MQNIIKVYYQVRFFLSPEIVCHFISPVDIMYPSGNHFQQRNKIPKKRKSSFKNKSFKRQSKPFQYE